MISKKNAFWRVICSLLPGAGEMYMGFMKMGLSLMTLFFSIVMVASIIEIGPLMLIGAIVWFFSFFHVHNLAGMPDEEFYALEDKYLFDVGEGLFPNHMTQTCRNTIAAVLIITGIVLTLRGMGSMLIDFLPDEVYWLYHALLNRIPQLAVGIAIIVLGVHMIQGKKQQLDEEESKEKRPDEQ